MANLNNAVFYHGILALESTGTAVNYHGILIILAPGGVFFARLAFPTNDVIFCSHQWPVLQTYYDCKLQL